jgi:thiamine pyrophosphokinase
MKKKSKGTERLRTALVICNGEPPSRRLAKRLARNADLIVAADGGANAARRLGITPHVIIGDLDSVSPSTRRFFSSTLVFRMKSQDNTDLEKALDYLAERKVNDATIIGATGRRVDFTLGNFSVVWNYTSSMHLTFVGDEWRAIPVTSSLQLSAAPGTMVSLVPFGHCSGITLKGLQYPLSNGTMRVGEIGVSNVVMESPFRVKVRRGKMLVFIMDNYR